MSIYYLLNVCLLVLFSLPGAVNHSSLYLTFSTEIGKFHIFLACRTIPEARVPGHSRRYMAEADGALLFLLGVCV